MVNSAAVAPTDSVPVAVWPLEADDERIHCPRLVVRGGKSDLLRRDTVVQMTQRGPRAGSIEIPAVGHALRVMHDAQVAVVRHYLTFS